MPQTKHVFFDSNGTKELVFSEESRWAMLPEVEDGIGILSLQPVSATGLPSMTMASLEDFGPLGEPVRLYISRPESIDSLIDSLAKLRSMMEYDKVQKKPTKPLDTGCNCPECQHEKTEEKPDIGHMFTNLEEHAKLCMELGISPAEYIQRRAKTMGFTMEDAVVELFGKCGCPRCKAVIDEVCNEPRDETKHTTMEEAAEALSKVLPKELQEILKKIKGNIEVDVISVPVGEMPKEFKDFLSDLKKSGKL